MPESQPLQSPSLQSPLSPLTHNRESIIKTNIPAVDIALTGQHLIEASAGTGKTWTLTGIVLRLLIEAKRPPEKIICTTFTRKATAEMKERILARINEFYYLLLWLEKIQQQPDSHHWLYPKIRINNASSQANDDQVEQEEHTNQESESQLEKTKLIRSEREQQLLALAKLAGMDGIEDPVNLHLLHYLLDNHIDYPLSMAIRRTQLLLISMDKLFVGTLDSLAQKWLGEYSSETGFQKGMSISANEQEMINDIIHDQLRLFRSQIYQKSPTFYQLLDQLGKLTDVDAHVQSINKAMQFLSTPIDVVEGFDFLNYQKLIAQLAQHDISDVRPYFDDAYKKKQGLNGRTNFYKNIACAENIVQCVRDTQELYVVKVDDDSKSWLLQLVKVIEDPEGKGFGFNKNRESERATFVALPTTQLLYDLHCSLIALDNEIYKLNYNIAQAVRAKLPVQLEESNQTTFSLQMVRLNQALQGNQGQKLAKYIRHHYPIALIDESQDINGEQAKLIESIYLKSSNATSHRSTKNNKRNFLLLVGDPKQAIYGFRGGDVANYNAMKDLMITRFNSQMTLTLNRRSSSAMVHSLNEWFTADKPELKQLGENIEYQQIQAFKEESTLSWHAQSIDTSEDKCQAILGKQSLAIIHLPYKSADKTTKAVHKKDNKNNKDETAHSDADKQKQVISPAEQEKLEQATDQYQVLASHIHYLLNSNQTIDGRAIETGDIAVLGRRREDLQQSEWALTKLNISSIKTTETSVFASQMATDLLAVLQAINHPFKPNYVNRSLTTAWYGLSLHQLAELKNIDQKAGKDTSKDKRTNNKAKRSATISYYQFQMRLQTAEQRWIDYGVMSAVQYLLAINPFASLSAKDEKSDDNTESSVWEQLAQYKDAERYLLDLRQLLELLAQHSRGKSRVEVIDWLTKQISEKPEDDTTMQNAIPTDSGVQLMTIHKSKGLEFPIVYIVGMTKSAKKRASSIDLYPYIANSNNNDNDNDNDNNNISNNNISNNNSNEQQHYQLQSSQTVDATSRFSNIRRLSPVKEDAQRNYQQIMDNDNLGETKRVAYVALTRASEQVYVLLKDNNSKKDIDYRPANIWLECQDAEYTLPERLNSVVDWIESIDILNADESLLQPNNRYPSERQETNFHASKMITYPNYNELIKKRYFVGWSKTSFTALSRQLDNSHETVAISEPDYLFESDEPTTKLPQVGVDTVTIDALLNSTFNIANEDVRFSFVRGAGAGTFLHQVLEKIDFVNLHTWSEVIDKGIREYSLPASYISLQTINRYGEQSQVITTDNDNDDSDNDNDNGNDNNNNNNTDNKHDELKAWLNDVLHTPMLASGQCLKGIPIQHRKAELGFDMGLSDNFQVKKINQVFAKHLDVDGVDKDKLLNLSEKTTPHYYRYLRGEIDLVYEHAGKYYVVDYKSNYLGDRIADYHVDNLNGAMSKAGYWLQAVIYQVALHRLLKLRVANYQGNEAKYLGAVEYVFLRGCVPAAHDSVQDTTKKIPNHFGTVIWDIPIALVNDMDALFGV